MEYTDSGYDGPACCGVCRVYFKLLSRNFVGPFGSVISRRIHDAAAAPKWRARLVDAVSGDFKYICLIGFPAVPIT